MVRSSFPWFLLTQVQNGLFSPQKLLAKGEGVFWAFREVSVPREAVRATEEVQSRPCAYLHNPALACAWPLNEGTDSIHRRRSIFSGFSFFFPSEMDIISDCMQPGSTRYLWLAEHLSLLCQFLLPCLVLKSPTCMMNPTLSPPPPHLVPESL